MKIKKNIQIEGAKNKSVLLDLYYKKDGSAKPVVIFAHGFKGFKDWGHWHLIAKKFATENFFFIKFNFSHNGTTPDTPTEFSDLEAFGKNNYSIELNDLGKVIDWLCESPSKVPAAEVDKNKIYLVGHSRGGGIVLLKAAQDERVKKVATLASVADFSKRWAANKREWKKDQIIYIENSRTGQHMPMEYQIVEDYEANTEQLSIPNVVKTLQKPLLIIHGTDDEAVDTADAEKLAKWAKKAELLQIEDANHVFGGRHPYKKEHLPEDTETALEAIVSFFNKKND